ncbi:MAG: small multi-drug export protein [Alicyclobacillus sp.]|nr:small multi-drug export protein [Alicyclobacillus sp.]
MLRRLAFGGIVGLAFLAVAFLVGDLAGRPVDTASLIGTAIVLEAQPAAAASLPLHFHPLVGGIVSILGNLVLVPVLVLLFDEITSHWSYARRKLRKVESWSHRYGRYGVWVLVPLCPVLGAYVCIAIGWVLRWNPRWVMGCVLLGMVASTFLITYGGESVVRLLWPWIEQRVPAV